MRITNVSELTRNIETLAAAVKGRWGRGASEDCTWVLAGQVAFVEGDLEKFPYKDNVMAWHSNGTGHWGILK